MALSVALHKKIVNFLMSLPNINDSNGQQAFINSAALDDPLQRLIKFPGSPAQFFQLLVPQLVKYGQLEDGRNALEAILEATKDYVGRDKKAYCDRLIQELRVALDIDPQPQNPEESSLPLDQNKLVVFVSSIMEEFRDVSAEVGSALKKMYTDTFIYENSTRDQETSVTETSLKEIERSDVYVGLFGKLYGEVTVREFQHVRKLGKPCLVYIRDKDGQREEKLEQFLKEYIYGPESGVVYKYFESSVDLKEKVGRDIIRLLVDSYRQADRELPSGAIQPVVRLAWDVADWYQSLGYTLELLLNKRYPDI